MQRLAPFLLLCAPLGLAQTVSAAIVHVADGDCASLSKAAAAPPGKEPSLIVLARNGRYLLADTDLYAPCTLNVTGHITIDGAGALLQLLQIQNNGSGTAQITINTGAQLTLRNLNLFAPDETDQPSNGLSLQGYYPVVQNGGALVLDAVSASNSFLGYDGVGRVGGGFVDGGNVVVRNSSFDNFMSLWGLIRGGTVEISHSTISAQAGYPVFTAGIITVANSIIMNGGKGTSICQATGSSPIQLTSLGGNVVSDNSCGFSGPNDRFVADARFLDFASHGGVVNTRALNYDSPAIRNGLAVNCDASDARGVARGSSACDSGAYEFGGGNGALAADGMNGFYYDHAFNGHYVSIQRLSGNSALVIWNTFDETGKPAWLYGVGGFSSSGSGVTIDVGQVAENVGGILHPGGPVTGATPTLWGSFQIVLDNCYGGTFSYTSVLPTFGAGSTSLQRLLFSDGVNCSN